MSRRWVVNASPIILLGKVQRIDLLPQLADEVLIAEGVVREIETKIDGQRTLEVRPETPVLEPVFGAAEALAVSAVESV